MKISIIITSYNSEKYLKYSINSVLKQTYDDFELIIVDDASKDKSLKIINNFKKKDKRIKSLFLKKNSGTASFPRNEGVKITKGEYICFLDADDVWDKKKLEEQVKLLNKNTLISFTSCSYIRENGSKYSTYSQDLIRGFLQKFIIDRGVNGLFAYNPIILSSVLIKKSEFVKYYFDTSKSIVGIEDLDLWLKILFKIKRKNIIFCNHKLVKIRRTSNSLNINYSQASLRSTYCLMKFYLEKKNMKNYQYFIIGIILRTFKNLVKIYKERIKSSFLKFFLIFTSLYIIFFYTPFFWYAGDNLVFYDKPKLTKTLVILSGNGDVDYINIGYQRRYLDTKILLEKNNFNQIILMGRSQEIEESEILRSLFIYDGIDKKNIHVVNKTFGNTKENISSLKNILLKKNIKEANFLTSPYHTKRSKLLWNAHKNEIDIYVTENINNPKKKIKWRFELSDIKVIIYEHLAIIYNSLRGWF